MAACVTGAPPAMGSPGPLGSQGLLALTFALLVGLSEGQGEGDCCSTVTLKADGEAASLYASYLGTVRHHS